MNVLLTNIIIDQIIRNIDLESDFEAWLKGSYFVFKEPDLGMLYFL